MQSLLAQNNTETKAVITRGANTTVYTADDVWGARFALTTPITGDGIQSIILTKINL